jgi:uncharacterized protein
MKVMYLHGLESAQGGPKVDFLAAKGFVFAPAMEYAKKNWSIDKLIDLVDEFNPDLIIGSSIGGYLADIIGSYTGIDTILFNPALHSRTIDFNLRYGKEGYKRTIVLGEEDDVIDPKRTEELVGSTANIIKVAGMGHRTDINTFKTIYNKYLIDETTFDFI